MSGNLFKDRNWLFLKGYLAIEGEKEGVAKPYPKEEDKKREQDPNQKEEKCDWGPDCPFCKAQKEEADLPHQQGQMEGQQQKPLPKPQVKRPDTLSMTKTKQQWEQEMERLNDKYNLDCFSDSELNSESDEDEQCRYQWPTWVRNINLKKKLSENQNGKKDTFFCNNIIFKNNFAYNNTKVLGNQNLLLMYNFDFSNCLDAYLYSYNLENEFCKMPTHHL